MQPEDIAIVRKHILWSLSKVSNALNAELSANPSGELLALESHLRHALRAIAAPGETMPLRHHDRRGRLIPDA